MKGLITHLRQIAFDLDELKAKWALVGALAVTIYTEPRTTRDIDIAIIAANKDEQEILINNLLNRGYHSRQELMLIDPVKKLGVRIAIPTNIDSSNILPIDLLFSSSGIESEIVANATKLEILPEVFLPVASRAHLLAMKILSQNDHDRIRDKSDINHLIAEASDSEISETRKALELIQQRGFNRDKNLISELEKALTLKNNFI